MKPDERKIIGAPFPDGMPTRKRMRYELALSAIGGLAINQLNQPILVAERAVQLADLVLEVLERKE